ncbi:PhnB protein [Motilibacter peucedani]|uniref:PhnB protein n=1 Tax=Motilibacter peucedani TaxID=598650 RepID=A0A420XPH6_9ACTN|nr:VOC family protein [Motilibacter peucedani]RKS74066.1 PhnB protein [Motilibacter peucedani]
MAVRLTPYISFDGNAREALERYRSVLGGTLGITTFAEMGETGEARDKVMHGMLETEAGLTLMGADTPPGERFDTGSRISVTLSGDDGDDLRRWFDALAEGGTVAVPMGMQPWGDEFGMCTDRFGVVWMVNITKAG